MRIVKLSELNEDERKRYEEQRLVREQKEAEVRAAERQRVAQMFNDTGVSDNTKQSNFNREKFEQRVLNRNGVLNARNDFYIDNAEKIKNAKVVTDNTNNFNNFVDKIKKNPHQIADILTDIGSSMYADQIKAGKGGDKLLAQNFREGVFENTTGLSSLFVNPMGEAVKKIGEITNNKGLQDYGNTMQNTMKAISEINNFAGKTTSKIDDGGYRVANNVSRTLGNMAPSIALSFLTAGGSTAVGAANAASKVDKVGKVGTFLAKNSGGLLQASNVAGNEMTRTLNEDNSNFGQAAATGLLKGTVEYATEKLFGGNIIAKNTSIDKLVTSGISKGLKSKISQKLASKAYEFTGEIAEEIISDTAGNFIDKIINDKDLPSLKQWWENSKETARDTFLTTAVLQALGLGGGTYNEVQELNLTKQQQAELNKAIDKIKNENVEKPNLKEQATKEIENSKINANEKQAMLDALNNMQEVNEADIEAIKQNINEIAKVEREQNKLPTDGNFKYDKARKQTYAKYKNDTNTYNSTIVDEVLDTVPTNKNGKRTVKQWTNAANEIGQRIANLSNEEIERIAYKSWFDVQPSKAITQYDNVDKKNVGFSRLDSDVWINNIYDGVNKARANGVQTQVQEEVKLPMAEKYQNKNNTEVTQEVSNYLKNNNIKMSVNDFMEWASNKQLEQESNMTPQQQELYSLIKDIQNRTSLEENIENNVTKNYETVHLDNGKDYQRKEIRSFKDNEGNEFRLYVLPNNHNELSIKEKGKSGNKTIRGSRNEILKEIQKYWKGQGTFSEIENTQKTLYNNTGSESEINGQANKQNEQGRIVGLLEYTRRQENDGRHQENNARETFRTKQQDIEYATNPNNHLQNLTEGQQKIKKAFEEKGVTLNYYDIKSRHGGFYTNNNLLVNSNNATLQEQKNEAIHEYSHHIIRNDAELNSKIRPVADRIIENEMNEVSEAVRNYIMQKGENITVDEIDAIYETVIEEMLSDYAVDISNKVDFSKENQYGIDEKILNDYKNIIENYLPEIDIENSNESSFNLPKKTIQGLENHNVEEVKEGLKGDIRQILEDNDLYDIDIVDLDLHGSRLRGTAKANSDLDVVVQYNGDIREDTLFDILNENPIEIDGVKVDINPIQEDIKAYMERSNKYDQDILSKNTKQSVEDTSNNTEENELQRKINRSMTMEQAKDMVQRAFVTGNIYEWFDGEYKNGDEWLAGEGADAVALVIDNDFNLQNKYVNANNDILNDEYIIEDVIEAYQKGTLTGKSDNQTQRLDTSKSTNYEDSRFYAPKAIDTNKELYNKANQRVTNANRQEIYKARADFILNAHNEGYVESLGLTQKEVNEKLRSWTSYPKNAMETSMSINKGVASENRWTGIENCSVVNELSVTPEQLNSLVKEIKGVSNDYQRRYISNTMLAIDTHMNYKNLTFDFAPDASTMRDSVLGDYQPDYDVIRVKRDGQNTVSHEMGHYIDHLIGRELGDGYNLGLTRLCRSNLDSWNNGKTFTSDQKQFIRNFANFLDSIEDSSDIGSSYKMSSDEVFARFVARFTEWTRNTATGNRYGYEAKWYDDKFNASQFREFAKLLQEYSLLKTTEQASGRSTTLASQKTGKVQDQRIDDIYSELFNAKQEEVTPPTKTEVTPPMNENAKFRKHYKSIIESSNTTPEAKAIAKELMGSDTYIPESNNKQLERADERISIAGADSELDSLLSRSMTGGNIKADDIAVGERLIQYYSKSGNKAKLAEAIQATAMAGTSAGQTVQAMSLLNHQTPQGQALWLQRSVEKMNNDLRKARGAKAEQFDLTPDMLDKIVNSANETELYNNLNEVYEELGQQVSKSMSQKVDAWRYFSMLANPRTHVRNIVGNMAMAKVQGIKNKVAGAIEGAVSKFNPEMERTHTIKPASKEVKAFAKADIENVADRLELNENKYNPKTRLENSMKTFKNDTLEKTIGKMFKINDSALAAEDGWGLKAGYRKALAEYMTANNLTPDNITDAQLAKARNYAVEQAKEATFHQESVIATAINQISNKNKFTKFLADATLPFKKTPINVAKAGVQYSPVGLAKSMVYDVVQLRKGNITVNQYIDNVSKGLTGTGIALIGYALAEAGILKADGDDDDKEGFEEDRGHQKYAITIGDNTYKLDWLAPSGIPLFIGAKTNELMKQSKEKKSSSSDDESGYQQAIDAATSILDAFTNAVDPMTEMSMLSGLSSTLKSYDNNLFAGVIVNMGKSYVNQFVPTALGQVAKTADEYERSTTSTKTGTLPKAIDMTKNQIMSKVPGLRQMLPTKTDTWGNEQKQAENVVQRGLENAVLPWTRKSVSSTKVDKELEQLYEDTGEKTVLPSALNKNMTINKEKYTLTSKEMADYKKQYGQDSYNLLNKLISDKAYKELSDEQKQKAIEKVYEYAKEAVKLDYAKNAKLPLAESTLTKSVNSLNDKTDYFVYLALTQGMTKDSEKIKTLIDADMTNASKKSIFESGFKDSRYDALKETGINITEYLKYKLQDFSADKKDDGTVNGKSISGSGKEKAMNYINNMKITYEQKLLLAGMDYALSSNEKSNIVSYVKGLKVSEDKKLEILNKVNGITVYKDGRVTWK